MKIKGKIVDETNQPIEGVIVASSAYKEIFTTTDGDGNFVLENDKITSISPIKISYVGYKEEFPLAKNLNGKTIQLKESNDVLNTVTVFSNNTKTQTNIVSEVPVNFLQKYKTPITIVSIVVVVVAGTILIKKALK